MTARNVTMIGLLSFAALVSACNSAPPPAPKEQPEAPKAVTAEERVKWYQDCWSRFNNQKWDEFKKCYADNATSQQAGYGAATATGADAIVKSSQDFARAAPDTAGEGQLILVNGNRIASIYLIKGTNSGPFTGPDGKEMPATNKKFGLLFGHHIESTPTPPPLVTKEVGLMDDADFAYQLGLSKNPGRPVMDKGEAMTKIVIAKNDDTEMKNVEGDKAWVEAFNKHDAAAVDSHETADFVLHDATAPKDMNLKEESESNKAFWKAFSDAKLTPSSIWGAGDYVVIVGTFEGTNEGNFPAMKLKKTGKKASLPFFSVDRLEGGKLKESWLIFDGAQFAAQLGVK